MRPQGLTALLLSAVIFGSLAAGYQQTLTPVTVVVDGASRTCRTHQETVGALLADEGIELRLGDVFASSTLTLSQPLEPSMVIEILRARSVMVEADGRLVTLRTHRQMPTEVLAEAGVSVGAYDEVRAEGQALGTPIWDEAAGPARLIVLRAVPITLEEDGQSVTLHTTARTVGEALSQVGISLYLADNVRPALNSPLSPGMRIFVERSVPVAVEVDGRTLRTRTHRAYVGDVLADLGIVLTGRDYAQPAPDTRLSTAVQASDSFTAEQPETLIRITRVAERLLIEQEPIPFEVRWEPDPDLEIDNQRLLQEGAPGVWERRIRVRYENGVEVSRWQEAEYTAVPPADKIMGYGTAIVLRTIDTPSGPLQYWRRISMLATSYSASTAGTPRTAAWYGRTAGGCVMDDGIVAVSTLVPWKSNVYVPGYGVGYACDRGSAIRGRRIDLGYADDNLRLWYSWVDVYLLAPAPDPGNIQYIIEQ